MTEPLRWGILGPGRIARKFAHEWQWTEGAELTAVASRKRARARAFADEFRLPRVYGGYEALLDDPEIDAVYIATPHNHHRAWTEAALRAGKGVLCEKPMGVNAPEVGEMIEVAREERKFLMEAVKTPFMPAVRQALEWVREGRIGRPAVLEAFFCFDVGNDVNGRHLNPELAGGAVLDLAVYPLTLARLFLGNAPATIQAVATKASTGGDRTTAIVLQYPDGAVAHLTVSIGLAAGTHGQIWGSDGSIQLPSFSRATEAVMRVGTHTERFAQSQPGTMQFEVAEANRCIREGALESAELSWATSLQMAEWQDAILEQIR